MIKQLKTFTLNMVAGANIAIVAMMLLAGYSDHVSPADFPVAAVVGMTFPLFVLLNLAFLFFWLTFKWRYVWIPIVGYFLAYVPISIYMPLNLPKTPADSTLKVMSYNVCIYSGNKKYKDCFQPIYDYIEQEKPDIVCLQEDVDTWRRYVMDRYQKLFPYNDTTHFNGTKKMVNGVGMHTRFPILRKERIDYKSQANGSVAYYLKVGSDTVIVINNHLESTHLSKKDRMRYKDMLRGTVGRDTAETESRLLIGKLSQAAAQRAPAAEAIRNYIAAHSQYPVIVCGDFNDNPISYSRRVVAKGLTDCFAAAGRGLGLSYNQKGFFFRIDYILCSDDFKPVNCVIDTKIDASDHNPVICWLKMRDKP